MNKHTLPQRSLVLTGFMGTGKTYLGRLLSERLGLPFVDMDATIEERAGRSIASIFAEQGEAAFRAWEANLAAELGAADEPLVIATGGGTFLNPANRQALQAATIVCLTADPQTIYNRVKDDSQRPLLEGSDDRLTHIQRLLYRRRALYNSFRWQVMTAHRDLDSLLAEIIAIWEREREARQYEQLVNTPEGAYPLLVAEGLLAQTNDLLDVYGLAGRRTAIITDSNVVRPYGEQLLSHIPDSFLAVMQAGEAHKNMTTVTRLLDELARQHLDRNGLVIALGGGVVGDTAGFVAACYMRGVRLVQIPTSLLAMVDSSVGGKVGVDTALGKNLVGAFKQPALVLVDPATLETLPAEEYTAGLAEVIKAGFLANPDLLDTNTPLVERIKAAIQVKIDIVERDPYEDNERAHLNLGHTFAHAIEQVSGYSWRHGEAVGVGLVGAAYLSQRLEMLDQATVDLIERTVQAAGLPTHYRHFGPDTIYEAMTHDKKWQDGQSRFILLKGLGQPVIVSGVDRSLVLGVLERLRA